MTMRLVLVTAVALFQTVNVSAFDCGCPETCTSEALNESGDSPFRCGERISWLMKHHDLPEANACAISSRRGAENESGEDIGITPCRYEACHPEGCASKLDVQPDFHLLHNCGCPGTCTDDVMGETLPNMPFSCLARITYMVHYHHNPEFDACAMAVEEGYCQSACQPVMCGSTLVEPAETPVAMRGGPSTKTAAAPAKAATTEDVHAIDWDEASEEADTEVEVWGEISQDMEDETNIIEKQEASTRNDSKTSSRFSPEFAFFLVGVATSGAIFFIYGKRSQNPSFTEEEQPSPRSLSPTSLSPTSLSLTSSSPRTFSSFFNDNPPKLYKAEPRGNPLSLDENDCDIPLELPCHSSENSLI